MSYQPPVIGDSVRWSLFIKIIVTYIKIIKRDEDLLKKFTHKRTNKSTHIPFSARHTALFQTTYKETFVHSKKDLRPQQS